MHSSIILIMDMSKINVYVMKLDCVGIKDRVRVNVMVFNVTFNNISVISWRSVLLVEEAGVPGENYRPTARH